MFCKLRAGCPKPSTSCALWPPLTECSRVLPPGCRCLWSSWEKHFPRGDTYLAPLQVRNALKLAGLGVPETCLNHAARLNGSPSPKNVTPFGPQ